MSVPLPYYLLTLLAVMPSHLTVIKIYDSEWAWLSWRAASESLKAEGGTASASRAAAKANSSNHHWADYSVITNHLPVQINSLWWH